jgi:Sulfotransferase family
MKQDDLPGAAASLRQRHLQNLEDATVGIKRSRRALKELATSLKDLMAAIRDETKLLEQDDESFVSASAGEPRADVGDHASIVDQRLRAVVPVTQPMLLCSQVQRAGGTLLCRLFDGHPSCFAHPSELRWGRPRKWNWPSVDLSAGHPDDLLSQVIEGWPQRFAANGYHKYSNWTHRHHPEQARVYPFLFDATLQRRVFAQTVGSNGTASQRDVLNAYLTSLFNGWVDYQNLYREPKRWVTAFVPRLVMEPGETDRFFADYPDGLMVTLVREPGAWLSSFGRHVGMEDPDEALSHWTESAEASLRAHDARPDQVIVLLFEDLVHQTEAAMRRLCERMNIAFSELLLEPTYNSMPVLSDSSHALATGIDPDVTSRHREALSGSELDLVARTATPRYREIAERFALTQQT